jgi:hypothetical protein
MSQIARTTTTIARRSLSRLTLSTLIAGALLVGARPAHAAGTPEQQCLKALYTAAGKYAYCQQKAEAKLFGGGDLNGYQYAVGKCRKRYTDTATGPWLPFPPCLPLTPRFVDNGTTVTDNLTGLQWEKKTDDATVHGTDGSYSWSDVVGGTAADGTAFTIFLAALNDSLAAGGCFTGQCDWRLPTVVELQTILLGERYPCSTSPCIDPIFEPLVIAGSYWSATTDASGPASAWVVGFNGGLVLSQPKSEGLFVRAVRGGL